MFDNEVKDALKILVAGFFGGVVSVPFFIIKTNVFKVFLIFCGSSTAFYINPLVLEVFDLNQKLASSTGFLIGVFGMQVIKKVHDSIKEADFEGVIDLLTRKFGIFKPNPDAKEKGY